MPKLILFVVFLIVFAVFAAVNTQMVEINYLIGKGNVALVVALVISFTLGVLVALPIALFGRSKAAKRAEQSPAGAKMTRAEKKAAKQAQTQRGAGESGFPEAAPANDELIKEKLGMESPRGKISLK